ncbi:type I glyceraldehyde-3-phosphate dehydrogenase [Chromatocurvus halotolerans]|uniref:Glyceraldehyde 3-phosphate dehydrogenase n=1 Tax=Chromatocurvus halotolerans TaxID=1132028 RepID=A0A4V2SC19_9GAMM|nr:glyceraldehyde 3-phosphate dehydrogenase NAD-binding domain-containing protein [Chromatocurvus halotolerans]TCO77590.1 glyceraldehyde 3-phosphate dehydrogenase [Chromatocurvus halotolerans]
MSTDRPVRLGLMGFGQTGRQLYDLASHRDDITVIAIADIGKPQILHYLLQSEVARPAEYSLDGNYLVGPGGRTRLMSTDQPAEMPWDVFDVDLVIDATGRYRSADEMRAHLGNGAPRVLLRTLPGDDIDRIVIPGVNEESIAPQDRMVSAGSPTTSALCLLLHTLSQHFVIECGSATTVHAYTSDQALQDYAGSDYRRSRSAARNIIPNGHEAGHWLGHVLPLFAGKITTSTLNVPVQEGCLLDVNLVFEDAAVTADDVNRVMTEAAKRLPEQMGVIDDPIVSSDVLGSSLSLLFDIQGTLKAGEHFVKTLSWYETRGHAARLLDVARLYHRLDAREVA